MKIVRQNESCEERESRLSQVRKNIANSRAREKSPVREMRLLHQQIQTFTQRQRESSVERLQRFENQHIRSVRNRHVITLKSCISISCLFRLYKFNACTNWLNG